ncbi:TonB-dependent receptor plug domain-containing protein [Autumnicola musiva]|uniref:TonB-dependent receptor n=1 Tax=Autumnicola musiva TaxID=3075589 RepID=A0ABU3DB34_9FLAO|nr:TonB-dependent receptor plug domain-containing protein [Zunongwangia sp. F117]MDT0678746.1 TonB-dependent receptor [Zunongwangia sp. F117]
MKPYFFLFYFLSVIIVSAQQTKDSLSINKLEEVVVTGQYDKQSVDKSVFEVKVITRKTIDQLAANNLSDVLNQSLNINIIPNPSTGKSGVELFGLDSQYFKILLDGIPLINDEGLGNNTDLTQINLDDIEQVEIVEGAMGVQYGSNAVSGIINIITKKESDYKWQITPYIQEETIGNEYGLFDKGRHIQSMRIGHNFSDKFYANATYTRNDFAGLFGEREGRNYQLNDGKRGYQWLPKLQNNAKTLFRYHNDGFTAFYRFEYFDEHTKKYNPEVRTNLNSSTQTTNPTASDEEFFSERFYHHLSLSGRVFKNANYQASFSYQQQKRNVETYIYQIKTREELNKQNFEYESRQGLYSRGTLNNLFKKDRFSSQLGYELSNINGYSSSLAGDYNSDNIERRLESYELFTSAEFEISKKFSFRPGYRIMFSSKFEPQGSYTLSSVYRFGNGYSLRANLGSAPRNPNYDELYTYFVDVNHDVQGNPDVNPERGNSAFLHLKKTFWFDDYNLKMNNKFSGWFLSVDDRIELSIVNQSPLAYKYLNIDSFKNWGLSYTSNISMKNFSLGAGISFSGERKELLSQTDYNDDYLYGLQLNGNLSYSIPKWNSIFSVFFKHNGPEYQFIQSQNEDGDVVFIKGKRGAYSWMDATLKKTFLERSLEVSLGARNILDVTNVTNTNASGDGVHSISPDNSVLLGYGRSYFLKLLYNLNF